MATIDVKDASGATVALEKPLTPGRAAAASSRPVTLSTEDLAALTALHTDLATTLAGYVDGLETLIGTSNTSLSSILTALTSTIAGYVDGLETLVTSSNTKLDTIHTDLATTLAGYVDQLEGYTDGLETLITSTNTKLDTLHTDIATTLAGYVDGLEALMAAATPAGTNLIGKVKTKFIESVAATMTRPNDTTAYAANDAIANNTSAGSVTPLSFSMADVNDDLVTIERARVITTDTGFQGKAVRLWLFRASPTIGAGDNAAFTVPRATFIGTLSGTLRTFSDGAGGLLVPDEGSRIVTLPTSGAKTVFGLLQALEASGTPVAQSTWITTVEGFQGAA